MWTPRVARKSVSSRKPSIGIAPDGRDGAFLVDDAEITFDRCRYARTFGDEATVAQRIVDAVPLSETGDPSGYVAVDPQRWIGHPSVGSGECVPLASHVALAARRSCEGQRDASTRHGDPAVWEQFTWDKMRMGFELLTSGTGGEMGR